MEKIQEDFKKAFELYWYKKKPISRRLRDSMEDEEEVCALFFETLNEYGMLDKCYPIENPSTSDKPTSDKSEAT